jgi:transposase
MVRYVGIDLHKHLLVACILDERGEVLSEVEIKEVTRDSLEEFCYQHLTPEDQVALEVTTHVWAVVRILRRYVARVVAGNPVATKAIAQAKIKTDKVDAHVLAQLLRLDFLPTVWAPDEELSQLRELTARRARLAGDRTKLINRIRTCLAMRLLDCPFPISSARGREWLAEVSLDADGRWLIDSDLRLLEAAAAEIALLDQRLAKRVYEDERVKLLMTLPGVSQQVAQHVVAAVGDVSRFATPEKLASYLGLVPSTRQSAAKCYHGGITKAGRVQARWALVQAAHCARFDLGPLGHFFQKVRRRKCYNVAVVAVARKLAMLAWHLLTSGKPYRYAKPQTVQAKLSKLRVAGSGQQRRGGVPKGTDPRTMRRPKDQNMKRTPSLKSVLESEGLPEPAGLQPGEAKMLEYTGTRDYYDSLQRETVRPKRHRSAANPAADENQ